MSEPYHPFQPLERALKEKNVSAESLFKYLVLSLSSLQVVYAALSFDKADTTANAFDAIMGMMKLIGKGDRPPKTVFEIIDAFVLNQLTLDRLNGQHNEIAAANAKIGEVLHLLLQDYQNQIEAQALQARITLENRGMYPPKNPPQPPKDEQD